MLYQYWTIKNLRLVIGDIDNNQPWLSDTDLAEIILLAGHDRRWGYAPYLAMKSMAAQAAAQIGTVSAGDYSGDGPAVAASLMEQARGFLNPKFQPTTTIPIARAL